MKETIRRSVFETNSSSVHTLTMCSGKELEQWKNGEILFNPDREEFLPANEVDPKLVYDDDKDIEFGEGDYEDIASYDMYYDYNGYFRYANDYLEYESFEESKTIEGVKVYCFGYFGHD